MEDVYLSDFLSGAPKGTRINESELNAFLAKPLDLRILKKSGKVFINYPHLFGEEFSNVWFENSLLLENHNLYRLSLLLKEFSEAEGEELFCENDVFVTSFASPLSITHWPGRHDFVFKVG